MCAIFPGKIKKHTQEDSMTMTISSLPCTPGTWLPNLERGPTGSNLKVDNLKVSDLEVNT